MEQRRSRVFRAAVSISAWAFILGTLVVLGGGIVSAWPNLNPAYEVMNADVDGVRYAAVGLSYHGTAGLTLMFAQFLLIAAALAASLLPNVSVRRSAHIVLIAWCLLWLGNAVWLATVDPAFEWLMVWLIFIALFALGAVSAVARAALAW
jgi:hypothetical protein